MDAEGKVVFDITDVDAALDESDLAMMTFSAVMSSKLKVLPVAEGGEEDAAVDILETTAAVIIFCSIAQLQYSTVENHQSCYNSDTCTVVLLLPTVACVCVTRRSKVTTRTLHTGG
jgi:hypothetical protein